MDQKTEAKENCLEPIDLSRECKAWGWSEAGVCVPELSSLDKERYQNWLEEHRGPQMAYLERRKEERLDPRKYFPQVKSVLVFLKSYFRGWAEGPVKISNYAWSKDYHEELREHLQETTRRLESLYGPFDFRIAVDTSPVLEKVWAVKAGVGWQGKKTLVLHPKWGSQTFIGIIYSSIEIERFQIRPLQTNHCGRCQRCVDACPTQALQPYQLDAGRCISYWTLEHKGPFTSETPHWNSWVAGCDICQEVCPWNQKLVSEPVEDGGLQHLEERDITDPQWTTRIASTALNYVPEENWKRNVDWITSRKDSLLSSQSN